MKLKRLNQFKEAYSDLLYIDKAMVKESWSEEELTNLLDRFGKVSLAMAMHYYHKRKPATGYKKVFAQFNTFRDKLDKEFSDKHRNILSDIYTEFKYANGNAVPSNRIAEITSRNIY